KTCAAFSRVAVRTKFVGVQPFDSAALINRSRWSSVSRILNVVVSFCCSSGSDSTDRRRASDPLLLGMFLLLKLIKYDAMHCFPIYQRSPKLSSDLFYFKLISLLEKPGSGANPLGVSCTSAQCSVFLRLLKVPSLFEF